MPNPCVITSSDSKTDMKSLVKQYFHTGFLSSELALYALLKKSFIFPLVTYKDVVQVLAFVMCL